MLYRILADAVVVTHGLFILFVILGALLALRWPWVRWLHVPAALWGAWVELAGWVCPLTPLENRLRSAGGAAGYQGGFIERYVVPAMYPRALTRGIQLGLGAAVVLLNVALYVWVARRSRERGESGNPGSPGG